MHGTGVASHFTLMKFVFPKLIRDNIIRELISRDGFYSINISDIQFVINKII